MQIEIARRTDNPRTVLYTAVKRAEALAAAAVARRLRERKSKLESALMTAIDRAFAVGGGRRGDRHLAMEAMAATRACEAVGREDLSDAISDIVSQLGRVCFERAEACHVVGRSGLSLPLRATPGRIHARRLVYRVVCCARARSRRTRVIRTAAKTSSTGDPDSSSSDSDPPGDRASWRAFIETTQLATIGGLS